MLSGFTGFRFPPEVILLAVRWYLRSGLSYRDLEGLCCVVRSQAMLNRALGPCAGQMAGLSSSNAVASRNSGVVSAASS